MLWFLLWSFLYPANLYLFSRFSREIGDKVKTKVVSTAVSCVLLAWFLAFRFSFEWDWRLALWFLAACSPFLCSWQVQQTDDATWWRDFIVSPAIEELYYRCLLPQTQVNLLLNSLAFALAHGHSLLFDRSKADEVVGTCVISFAFGLVVNLIRAKSGIGSDNIWFWLCASSLHGLANYVGVPAHSRLSCAMVVVFVVLLAVL